MFQQMLDRVFRPGKMQAQPVIQNLNEPKSSTGNAVDELCDMMGEILTSYMKLSLAYRKHTDSLFKKGGMLNNIECTLTNPIDGRLFEVAAHRNTDGEMRYRVRVDAVDQSTLFHSPYLARKNIVDQVMKQRAQCRKEIAYVLDELAISSHSAS